MKTMATLSLAFMGFASANLSFASDVTLHCMGNYSDGSSPSDTRLTFSKKLTKEHAHAEYISASDKVTTPGDRFIVDGFASSYKKDGKLVYHVGVSITDTVSGLVSKNFAKNSRASLTTTQGESPNITELVSIDCDVK